MRVLRVSMLVTGTTVLFLTGQIVGIVLLIVALQLFGYSADSIQSALSDNSIIQFIAVATVGVLTVGLLYLVHRFAKKPFRTSIKLTGLPTSKHVSVTLLGYGLYFLCFVVVATLASLLIPALDTEQMQQLGFESPAGYELIFVFSALVILPSITEEIVFRGFLFERLRNIVSLKLAVIITSVLFGAAHLEFLSASSSLNWIAGIDTTVFSLFLIWVYVKTNSLWAPIMLHALKNTVAFVVLFII